MTLPEDTALRMLCARFGCGHTAAPAASLPAGLTGFQTDAVHRLLPILERRNGAILADSVGLGKTHVAAAVAQTYAAAGADIIVAGPPTLARHWKRHLHGMDGWRWVSHAALSRGQMPARCGRSLIIVDEAHAFRNRGTRRYRTLAELAHDATLLLLTATPVNNSVYDLLNLLRLFAADDAFADIGVFSLRTAADDLAAGRGDAMRHVVQHTVIRRTRAFIERHYRGPAGRPAARFPVREPVRFTHHDLNGGNAGVTREIVAALQRLSFTAHTAGSAGAGRPAVPRELLLLGLLKRLESGTAAFQASLRYHRRLLTEFVAAADAGLLMDVRNARTLLGTGGEAVQLPLRHMVFEPWPDTLDSTATAAAARADLALIDGIIGLLPARSNGAGTDPKIDRLRKLLRGELAGEKVLVFTEFRDTAHALWRELYPLGGVALITGSETRLGRDVASRSAVLRCFAPRGTGDGAARRHERVRVLIATDVLAEGLNLQDARVIISYDVPWNPVRLAQRIGRIDRLGSPHAAVLPIVFLPGAGVDEYLGLMRRVRRKLRYIRAVGGDAPWRARRDAGLLPDAAETAEALRLLHDRRCTGRPRHHTERPVAAAVWREPDRAALLCFAAGAACRIALLRTKGPGGTAGRADRRTVRTAGDADRRTTHIDDACVDATLIATLRAGPAPRPPDAAWLGAAARRARRLIRAGAAPRTTAPEVEAAARAVHRWLQQRAASATADECRMADCILAWLAQPMDAATEAALREALREHAEPPDRMTALARLARAGPTRTHSRDRDDTPRQMRLVAAIELVPVHEREG
jgi:hypothetical protein